MIRINLDYLLLQALRDWLLPNGVALYHCDDNAYDDNEYDDNDCDDNEYDDNAYDYL